MRTVLYCFVQVNLAAVQLGWSVPMDVDVMSTIRSLQPATINWSNVPEYMGPANFHKLAQSISAPTGTVHHMHRYYRLVVYVSSPCA